MTTEQNQAASTYESILKQAGRQKILIFNFSKTYPAYIILIIFAALSFLAMNFFDKQVNNDTKAQYDKAVTSVLNRFDGKYQTNQQILQSMRGVYDRLVQVVRDYFDLYASVPVKTYPSMRSIMYWQYVENKDFDAFTYYAQSTVDPNYKVHPSTKSEAYMPALYIVPQEKNASILGQDFDANPMLKEILTKSKEKDAIVATPVFAVRQPDTLGFYLISPVYKKDMDRSTPESRKKNYQGAVAIEINPRLFFEEALGEGIASDTSIIFECFDVNASKETKIYSSKNAALLNNDFKPDLSSENIIKIADREFIVRFATVPHFVAPFQKVLPKLALGISLVLSFAFFAFLLVVTTSKARAVDLAERLTRSQRRIVDSSKDIIAVMDLGGVWKSMNPASVDIFGIDPDRLIGSKIELLFASEKDTLSLFSTIGNTQDEFTLRTDYKMKAPYDETKWINWSFTISRPDGLVYCIGRDVTLEKIAEEQALLRSKQIQLAEQFTREASEFKSFFMIKLSHQLRNSLTGILGYLQLLSNKIFDTEEEHDSYVSLAEESSEELFTFISDIDDVSSSNAAETKDLTTIHFENIIQASSDDFRMHSSCQLSIEMMDESNNANVVADFELLRKSFTEVLKALCAGAEKIDLQVSATENPYEGATEVQMMTNANPLVADLINIYKNNSNNLIDALKDDKEDVLLHFSIAASDLRMLNGTMTIETFGGDEGNIVQITLPLNKVKS